MDEEQVNKLCELLEGLTEAVSEAATEAGRAADALESIAKAMPVVG